MGLKCTLEEVVEQAKKRGWKCVSTQYVNNHTKIDWICNKGLFIKITLIAFQKGNPGCSICSKKRRHTLEDIQKIANMNEGKCLSKEYLNGKTLMEFECKNNHRWNTTSSMIIQGSWCWKCYRLSRQTTSIVLANKKLSSRHITCTSTEYKNNRTKLSFKCDKGHEWMATYDRVVNGETGCPICMNNKNIYENICRNIFEKLFNKKFKRVTPNWLKSDKNRNMELDGYNEELKLAFEYQGIQHYKLDRYLNTSDQAKLDQTKKKDKLKKEICKKMNITLIVIPYTISKKKLQDYIEKRIKKIKNNNLLIYGAAQN